ncbi:prepilin peptidase [Nocardioides zeicaulis]|uniref:Prepilin peptidase n=1 Tax=Nocardioides zeicaulis TaxID=1776857 RepID=A0ABV6DWJ3_9ACTN
MSSTLVAALVTALLGGLGGLLVPALVARIPEPAPVPEEERHEGEPPKVPYADLAARPGLGPRCAVVSALAAGLLGWSTGPDWSLLWLVPLTPVAVSLAFIDWHTRLLPKAVVVPATLATVALVVAVGLATDERASLVRALVALAVVFVFYWLLWWFLPGAGMGYGDVRLSALVGLVLGWVSGGTALLGVWFGMALLGVPGLVVAIVRRDRSLMRTAYPFGPAMLVGALVGLVWGTALAGRIWG